MISRLRVFQFLVYLLLPISALRNLGKKNTSEIQGANDTDEVRDLSFANRYPKDTTKLSGTSQDPVVSYLNIQLGQTADLPLSSQHKLNYRTDFTMMFWFKVNTLPTQGKFMQIMSIQKSLSCFIDSQLSIQCDSVGIEPLRVSSRKILKGKWNHLTVAFFAATQTGYLMIQDDISVTAISYSKDASIVQASGPWSACIGMCMQKREGFIGGIREFTVRSKYILPELATQQKNQIAMYNKDITAYYRFQYDNSLFFSDQFRSRSFYWRSGIKKSPFELQTTPSLTLLFNNTVDDWKGAQMIPVNVCPQIYDYTKVYRFDLRQQVRLYELKNPQASTKYYYSVSLTFYKNSTTCFTRDINSAQNGCNLVHLEEVFMLYFQSANSARLFFYADKNFYQTQSVAFFIPNNQWITVKFFMSQHDGYKIFVLDQNNNILSQYQKVYNMQKQTPKQRIYLFQSLVGYVGTFSLSEEVFNEPNHKFVPHSPILNLNFIVSNNQNSLVSAVIPNTGGDQQPLELMFKPTIDLVISSSKSSLQKKFFDGITCDDGHQVLSFDSEISYLNFTTSPFEFSGNTQISSIEFWFKFENSDTYNSSSKIFQMIDKYVDPFVSNHTYWEIFMNSSALKIAPFGLGNLDLSAIISFQEFNLANEDNLRWWHIGCTFQFNVSIECFLSNQIHRFRNGYSMVNNVKGFPTYSLDSHFGYYKGDLLSPVKMLLKEVRIWKKVFTQDIIDSKRQLQIDPLQEDDILVYLRLNSLKNIFFNSVKIKRSSRFISSGSYQLISQVRDVTQIPVTRYNEITGLLELATEPQSHVVCPSYTYLKDQLCFSEPVNEVVLAIFPLWNKTSDKLSWMFTLKYSSMVDNSFFDQITSSWFTTDAILSKLFKQDNLVQMIDSDNFRRDNIYEVQVQLSNKATTFQNDKSVNFIPNACQWFEVEGYDAMSTYMLIQDLPGSSNITFSLILRHNSDENCRQRSFYDTFYSVDFQYFVSGSVQRIGYQPKAQYMVIPEEIDKTPNLKVDINIPAAEVANLPTFIDIRIMMSVKWTYSIQNSLSEPQDDSQDFNSDEIFQNVLFTVQYQTPDSSLLNVFIKPNSQVIAINQTMVIDASNVTTRNIDMNYAFIAYSWQCPSYFQDFCKLQKSSILSLPWQIFYGSGTPIAEYQQFQATVALVKDGQVIFVRKAQSQAVWYNIMKPEFIIVFKPNPILISNPQDTRFQIVPQNFDSQKFQNFTIQWQINGQLAGRQSITFQNLSQVMLVPSDSWKINSTYSISCVLTYTRSDAITTNNSMVINIYGRPYGGLAYISPRNGYLGDTFFIYLQGWKSYLNDDSIIFTVYTSSDELGNQIGQQLTQRPMLQNETFFFVAQSTYPLIVRISDITGEVTETRVVGTIANQTNPSLNEKSFMSSLFGRHLSEQDSQDFQLNKHQCNFQAQIQQILNQSQCKVSDNISIVGQIANSTCKQVDMNKNDTIYNIYDTIVRDGSPCKDDDFLKLSILDIAYQFTSSQYICSIILSRARRNQFIDSFSGKNLQIVTKKVSYSHSETLQTSAVSYNNSIQSLLDFTDFNDQTFLQLIVLQYRFYETIALVQIIDKDLQKQISISDYFGGQITFSFNIIPEFYIPNITVCAVISKQDSSKSTESCLTQLVPAQFQVICTCNIMFVGDAVALTRDYSRQQSAPVTFPDHQIVVFASGISQIQKNSYIFITIIGSILLYGLVCFALLWTMDKKDYCNQEIENLDDQTATIELISSRLELSQSFVKIQMKEIKLYASNEVSALLHVAKAIHPVVAPFLYFLSSQTRTLRFATYHSQVNIMVIVMLLFFGRQYRQKENRFEEVLDLVDIQAVSYSIVLGSIWLVPTLAEKINQICEENQSKRYWQRGTVYLISFILNNVIILLAVYTAYQAPASNQYLIAISIAGSLVVGAIFTNTARVLFNSFELGAPFSHLQSQRAKTVLVQIDCVRKVKQQLNSKQVSDQSKVEQLNTESELNDGQQTEQTSIELSISVSHQTTRDLNEGFRDD